MRSSIQDGMNGLLFDPDAPGALATQMRLLLSARSAELRAQMARNGRTTSKMCSLDVAEKAEGELLAEVTEP